MIQSLRIRARAGTRGGVYRSYLSTFSFMRLVCLFCAVGGLLLSAAGQSPQPATPLRQAQEQVNSGHFDEALRTLDVLAAQQPEPAGVDYLRGTVFYHQGKMID